MSEMDRPGSDPTRGTGGDGGEPTEASDGGDRDPTEASGSGDGEPARAPGNDAGEATGEAIRLLAGFGRALRRAGLTVGSERMLTYLRAVESLGVDDLNDLYWAGRVTLVASPGELALYDRIFRTYFLSPSIRRTEAGEWEDPDVEDPVEGRLPQPSGREDPGTEEPERADPTSGVALTLASPTESLRHRSFEEYTEEEHARARALIERLATREPRRRSRRTRPSPRRGIRPDLPRSLRRALRTEGEPLEWAWRRRRTRPRRLVLVLDISGSMAPYARSLAQFAHAAVLAGRDVEAFAFGTRLTHLTPALRSRDRDAVLDALGRSVPDWEGGTRIGESLEALLDGWGRRGPLRGSIVVILSDGLERGDPAVLGRQMERLSRIAHRIVWVNPLKGSPEYEPLARGIAAALPHVDRFLPGHNLESLEELADVLTELGA